MKTGKLMHEEQLRGTSWRCSLPMNEMFFIHRIIIRFKITTLPMTVALVMLQPLSLWKPSASCRIRNSRKQSWSKKRGYRHCSEVLLDIYRFYCLLFLYFWRSIAYQKNEDINPCFFHCHYRQKRSFGAKRQY